MSSAKGIKAPQRVGFLLYGIRRNIAQPDVARGHFHATTSHVTTMDGTLSARLAGREVLNSMDGMSDL